MSYLDYSLRPLVLDALMAHKNGWVKYSPDGVLRLSHPSLPKVIKIPLENQYPGVLRATFDDLNKPLSAAANSPLTSGQKSLRQLYDEEREIFENAVIAAQEKNEWAVGYGSYVYDSFTNKIAQIAPEFWHRLSLVTSNAKLLMDKERKLTWKEIREIFENKIVGVAGASVGGNIFEGMCREMRPKRAKIADMDAWEATNLNRAEGMNIFDLSGDRSKIGDPKDFYDVARVNKSMSVARRTQLVDPYMQIDVYFEGLTEANMDQFLLGDDNEPKLDLLIEEVDYMPLKHTLRQKCKEYGIPLLMLSDFGNRVQVQMLDFAKSKIQTMGWNISDEKLDSLFSKVNDSRDDRMNYIEGLCGSEFADDSDPFGMWVKGEGEQMGGSLPQSGATAKIAGGIGGKFIAMHFLGYKIPQKLIWDIGGMKLI